MSDQQPESLRAVLRARYSRFSTKNLEYLAQACVDELRNRGRSLGIEGDSAHHGDALRAIESLASSARVAEMIRRTEPANDGT